MRTLVALAHYEASTGRLSFPAACVVFAFHLLWIVPLAAAVEGLGWGLRPWACQP